MIQHPALFTAAVVASSFWPGVLSGQPAPTAGPPDQSGVLRFRVVDDAGGLIPARLTFVSPDGPTPELFTNTQADPDHLAVRGNVVYTLTGGGEITVPPGTYTVWASRGIEWSIASAELTFEPGRTQRFEPALVHEVNTDGWISADFHLHTLTHSGHGDSNMPERVISIIGEGVELAVATDHNHHTDYGPTMRALGATTQMTALIGNEVSVPIGHFNAFPMDPGGPLPDPHATDANALFAWIRASDNPLGVTPVIQVNHPRWPDIDYYGKAGLDPITGEPDLGSYSHDYDTVEVFNENAGWGYYDPDTAAVSTGNSSFCVLNDWFNLLNRGRTHAAVGNSDSHTVQANHAGYPRNFVRCDANDPAAIDIAEIATSLRARQVFTTFGPFVEFSAGGVPMGGLAATDPASGRIELGIVVRAASWIDCDVVKVVVNGDVVRRIPVPETTGVERLRATVPIKLEADSWITLLVEGDRPLAPIVHDGERPILPNAVLNPVWVDADGDGVWTPPYEQVSELVSGPDSDRRVIDAMHDARAHWRAMTLLAATTHVHPASGRLVEIGLGDTDRRVRLAAAWCAARVENPSLVGPLRTALDTPGLDAHLRTRLVLALNACGEDMTDNIFALLGDDAIGPRRFRPEFESALSGHWPGAWMHLGFFDCPGGGAGLDAVVPEVMGDRDATGSYAARAGEATWDEVTPGPDGRVDLLDIAGASEIANASACYLQCWIHSPDARTVRYALGTDDACRAWINDELVYADDAPKSANPLEHLGAAALHPGLNRVLLKVQNGTGDYAAYFQVFDPEVRFSATRGREAGAAGG